VTSPTSSENAHHRESGKQATIQRPPVDLLELNRKLAEYKIENADLKAHNTMLKDTVHELRINMAAKDALVAHLQGK
jgi:hypothetical protein